MALQHITSITKSLESYEWITDDWVKETLGKKLNKRARHLVSTHNARQFAIANTSRGWKRVQCSCIGYGDESRFLSSALISSTEPGDIICECGKKGTDEPKCEHIAVLLVTLALFKQGLRKQPHWMKQKTDEHIDINNLTDEQRELGIGLSPLMRLYALTLTPDSDMPYVLEENGAPEAIDAIPNPFGGDMKSRRKRSVYSMNRKRALLRAAAPQEGGFGRWALEHFTPELLAKLLEERPNTILTKIASIITEDEMVAFECGMQEQVVDFDDRVDQIERDSLAQMKAKRVKGTDASQEGPEEVDQPAEGSE
jgi:hypothetical protein